MSWKNHPILRMKSDKKLAEFEKSREEGVHYIKIQTEQNDLELRFFTDSVTSYVTEVHRVTR